MYVCRDVQYVQYKPDATKKGTSALSRACLVAWRVSIAATVKPFAAAWCCRFQVDARSILQTIGAPSPSAKPRDSVVTKKKIQVGILLSTQLHFQFEILAITPNYSYFLAAIIYELIPLNHGVSLLRFTEYTPGTRLRSNHRPSRNHHHRPRRNNHRPRRNNKKIWKASTHYMLFRRI